MLITQILVCKLISTRLNALIEKLFELLPFFYSNCETWKDQTSEPRGFLFDRPADLFGKF